MKLNTTQTEQARTSLRLGCCQMIIRHSSN
jgi:hypothetical protein